MRNSLNGLAGPVLAAVLSVSGLAASAQSIRFGTATVNTAPPVPTCIAALAPNNTQALYFDFGTANVVLTSIVWSVQGAGTLNITTGRSVTFTSNAINKARVTVSYVRESSASTTTYTCPGGGTAVCGSLPVAETRTLDFFKTFTISDFVVGPDCAASGSRVAYTINPVVSSQAMIQSGLGTDTYIWTIVPASAFVPSGDGSAITFTMPGSDVTVNVRVGSTCNASPNTGGAKTTRVGGAGTAPVLTFSSTCVASNSTGPITVSFPAVVGINYKFVIPSTWQITPQAANNNGGVGMTYLTAGTQSVTINADITPATAGTVQIIASNAGCGAAIGPPTQINRSLVSTISASPAPLTGNAYVKAIAAGVAGYPDAPGVTYTFSLAQAPPAGSTPVWALPAGWAINSGQNTAQITATPGVNAVAGNITVSTGGCAAATTLAVNVTTNTATSCNTYSVTGTSCAGFFITPPGSPCVNTGATYSLELFDAASPGAVQATAGPLTHPTTSSNFAIPTPPGLTIASAVIRLRVRKGNYEQLFYSAAAPFATCGRPAPPTPPGPGNGNDAPPAQLRAYPNPVGGLLTVDLLDLPANTTAALTLLDATGRVLMISTADKAHNALNVARIPAGAYTLRAVLPGGQTLSQQVIVQH